MIDIIKKHLYEHLPKTMSLDEIDQLAAEIARDLLKEQVAEELKPAEVAEQNEKTTSYVVRLSVPSQYEVFASDVHDAMMQAKEIAKQNIDVSSPVTVDDSQVELE